MSPGAEEASGTGPDATRDIESDPPAPTTPGVPVLSVASLLPDARQGDRAALDHLFELAYDELRRIARRVRRERRDQPLGTTTLVHEAYVKLAPAGGLPANDGAHFRRLMARAMRQVLVDAARRRHALRRGGGAMTVTFDDGQHGRTVVRVTELLDLDRALQELARVDSRRAAVVECRYFGGLDVDETATALGISTATVKRDWRVARAWLASAIR